ncbi:MAG: sensor histidine kinase [Candidatus Promineifilaceae bacterium]|jgi:signal transduction histidine kinase
MLGWLDWRQWLVLFGVGATVIIVEVRSHTVMWADHQSGQTFWTDPELIWEILLYGFVLPILAGIFLGHLTRTAVERDQISKELQLRRKLVARMQSAKSQQELAEVIATIPGNMVLADRAWFFAQYSGEDTFEQIAHWERPGIDLLPSHPSVTPAVCESCVSAASLEGTRILPCHHSNTPSGSSGHNRYCLWLTSENTGKATLLFETPVQYNLEGHELKALDELGNEIALAIENANLLLLKQRQVDAARDERLRIARNLHDTVGQNVSYLRFKLDQLTSSALTAGPAEFRDELSGTLGVADEIYEQMRDTLEELRTTEKQDLEQIIGAYAGQAAARSGFVVNVRTIGQPQSLSPRRSREIVYIVREALNNVEKHAGAEEVGILLQYGEEEFRLTVCDNGKGFQPDEVEIESRYGVVIMSERASSINADLAIESSPGQGTEVALRLPLSTGAVVSTRNQ